MYLYYIKTLQQYVFTCNISPVLQVNQVFKTISTVDNWELLCSVGMDVTPKTTSSAL